MVSVGYPDRKRSRTDQAVDVCAGCEPKNGLLRIRGAEVRHDRWRLWVTWCCLRGKSIARRIDSDVILVGRADIAIRHVSVHRAQLFKIGTDTTIESSIELIIATGSCDKVSSTVSCCRIRFVTVTCHHTTTLTRQVVQKWIACPVS